MSVLDGRMEDRKGNKGCCIDRHGHPFCNQGCTWEHPKDLPEAKGEEE